MQSVSSRIWTRVAVFISYDDNDYTTGRQSSLDLVNQLIEENERLKDFKTWLLLFGRICDTDLRQKFLGFHRNPKEAVFVLE